LLALGLSVPTAAAADEWVVPSETCRGLWIVPVSFGDDPGQTLDFVLDTGAGTTSVDPDSLGWLDRPVRAGKSTVLRGGKAGPLSIHKIKVQVHEMDHLGRALGRPIDGILGFPTFKSMLLTLDYPAGEVRVSEGSLPEVDGQTVFRDVGKTRPYLALEVGGATIPVLLDSGSADGFTLRESDPLSWESEPRGVSGSVRYSGVRLDTKGRLGEDLVFGPLVAERPIVEIVEDGTRLSGVKIMHRFVWTFDQRKGRIRMIADSDSPIRTGPVWGMGLAFRPVDAGFEVVHVFADAPGADAEIRQGDVVTAIDGTPVYRRGCASLNDPPGDEEILFSIVREGEKIDVRLAPRILVP